ncbi:MAG: hypothetical protein KAG26_02275 [Methylococcales bacterium]|nr:hypothetical protein [Methylococcales bacterium]
MSAASLGVAIFSSTVFPLLRPLAWAGFLYTSSQFFKKGYDAVVKKQTVNMAVVDTVMFLGLIITGNLIAGTLMCTLLWLAQKILLKTENHARKNLVSVFSQQPRSV